MNKDRVRTLTWCSLTLAYEIGVPVMQELLCEKPSTTVVHGVKDFVHSGGKIAHVVEEYRKRTSR